MLIGAKDGRAGRRGVAANPLKYGRTIMNHVRHHVDVRVFPADELSFVPDLVGLLQRHEYS